MKEKRKFFSLSSLPSAVVLAILLFASCEQPPGKLPETSEIPDTPETSGIIEEISISSSVELAKIGVDSAYPLSAIYTLTSDITLENWTPIGSAAKPFYGVFDGNGKTVTLNSFASAAVSGHETSGNNYLGIFGCVKGAASRKAEIKNLTIDSSVNVSTTAANQTVGLLTGYAELAEITNMSLSGTLTFNSSKTIVLGGVAGYINLAGTIIKDCNSSMTMNITPGNGNGLTTYNFVGGFAGMFDGGAGIENCHNTGNITADSSVSASQVFVGGITGGSSYAMNKTYKGYIQDCSYIGTVIGKAKGLWTFVGGIAGTIVSGTVNSLENTTRIVRCYVEGTVSCEETGSGNPYIGGIVGYNYYGALVSQCYFNGTVIADKTGDYTGGIAGYNSQTTTPNNSCIEDCWSAGEVKGFNNAGGIVGQNQINTYIRRCYSIAAVTVTNQAGTGIGGIAGMNVSTNTDAITACVALNKSLTTPKGNNINRVTGTIGGNRSNNYAWANMPIDPGIGTYTERKGDTLADGTDCVEKPDQNFYIGRGWDFTYVWKMAGDYPKLKWQN